MTTKHSNDNITSPSSSWTQDEISAVISVRQALLEKGIPSSCMSEIELITIVSIAKFRIEESIEKYMTYFEKLLIEYNIIVEEQEHPEKTKTNSLLQENYIHELSHHWHRFSVTGTDDGKRGVMYINGGETPIEEERNCIRASTLYYFAVHADIHTLRNGSSMVIDMTFKNNKVKYGNEKKLQIAWQNYPLRPQHIFILGTNVITRIAVNGLIAFASLFAKSKVIARIKFETVEGVSKVFGWREEDLPKHYRKNDVSSSSSSGVVSDDDQKLKPSESDCMDVGVWIKQRLERFPLMGLPDI